MDNPLRSKHDVIDRSPSVSGCMPLVTTEPSLRRFNPSVVDGFAWSEEPMGSIQDPVPYHEDLDTDTHGFIFYDSSTRLPDYRRPRHRIPKRIIIGLAGTVLLLLIGINQTLGNSPSTHSPTSPRTPSLSSSSIPSPSPHTDSPATSASTLSDSPTPLQDHSLLKQESSPEEISSNPLTSPPPTPLSTPLSPASPSEEPSPATIPTRISTPTVPPHPPTQEFGHTGSLPTPEGTENLEESPETPPQAPVKMTTKYLRIPLIPVPVPITIPAP